MPDAQLTHIGLFVEDLDGMVNFYTRLVGFVISDRGEFQGRHLAFLSRRADEHHQLVLVTGRHVEGEIALLSQLSFRVEGLEALRFFHRRALELGAAGMEGRNHGNSWSIYFEDPEGNRIEVYTPTPWHVSQPWRVALDLNDSNDAIETATLELIQESAQWEPVENWRERMAAKLRDDHE